MAWGTGVVGEVRSTGSDTQGGFFNTASAGFATDLQATTATSASPVIFSPSYNFVASDIGSYAFVKFGTSWIAGWYLITSVASGLATINAGIGNVILPTCVYSTLQGCAIIASPTGGTWGVDYSQQTTSPVSVTDAVGNGTTTVTSASALYTVAMVGNVQYMAGGSASLTAGWYEILTYVSTTSVTVDRVIATGTGITAKMGGALASLGTVSAALTSGTGTGACIFIQSATYIMTNNSSVSGGIVNMSIGGISGTRMLRFVGYATHRTINNTDTKPILRAASTGSPTLFSTGGTFIGWYNLNIDGGTVNASRGISASASTKFYLSRCLFTGTFVSAAISSGTAQWIMDDTKFNCNSTGAAVLILGAISARRCEFTGVTSVFPTISLSAGPNSLVDCLFYSNNNPSVDFIQSPTGTCSLDVINCSFYGAGTTRHAIYLLQTSASVVGVTIENCIFSNMGGYGVNCANATDNVTISNCAFFNCTSGPIASNVPAYGISGTINLTMTPFNNAATGDFALNNNGDGITTFGGKQCRASALPGVFPSGLTIGYRDIGAVQHITPPLGMTISVVGSDNVLLWDADVRATTYNVLRSSVGATGPFTVIASGLTSPTYTDVGAASNNYWYNPQGVP